MKSSFDMHLAAASIARSSVDQLAALGFTRDHFANFTCCQIGDYHATYHGSVPVPDDNLWHRICAILQHDATFSGYLEEEATPGQFRQTLVGTGTIMPSALPAWTLIDAPAGRHKACDVHMSVFLDSSSTQAIDLMEGMKAASVDKAGPEGVRRVYTLTFESLGDGKRIYQALKPILLRVPGLRGKMKLEAIRRHLRKPLNAPMLPLATSSAVTQWLGRRQG